MEQITVSSRRDKKVEVDVPIACEITWNVQVESYGIVLAATFFGKENDEKGNKLLEEAKIKAEDGLQIYTFKVDKPGKVSFLFDNNHSRFRSKAINYRIDIKTLEEDTKVQEASE